MINNIKFTRWIPFTSLRPLVSFPQRLSVKIGRIISDSILLLCARCGISGAKIVGKNNVGNSLLRLNKNGFLGSKGSLIEAPRDHSIFESIRKFGNWEIKVSDFLSESLKMIVPNADGKSVLLDIGANVGLVTVQALNMSKVQSDVYLFEPLENHVHAIRHNVQNIVGVCNVHVVEVALSDKDGVAVIYTEISNQGNSSLLTSVVPLSDRNQIEISTVETSKYMTNLLKGYSRIVIKCDTQGMDALILARIPNDAWEKVFSACVEVWALPDISSTDVDNLIQVWSTFEFISWSPDFDSAVDLGDVRNYWLSKSNDQRNLFLRRELAK